MVERAITPADAFAPPIELTLRGKSLVAGGNRLVITKRGAGALAVGWDATAMVPSPGPSILSPH